jgi:hypothetical protein
MVMDVRAPFDEAVRPKPTAVILKKSLADADGN